MSQTHVIIELLGGTDPERERTVPLSISKGPPLGQVEAGTGKTIKDAKLGKEGMVGVPSVKGIGSAFKDFGVGAIGGLVFLIAYQLFGALGVIAAPLIAGSMIKGDRGATISTMAGFMLLAVGVLGMGGGGNGASTSQEVM